MNDDMAYIPENMRATVPLSHDSNNPKTCSVCHATYYGLYCHICPVSIDKTVKNKSSTPDSVWICLWMISFFFGAIHDQSNVYSYFCLGVWTILILFTRKSKGRWLWIALQGFLWFLAFAFIGSIGSIRFSNLIK